jgi:hypothetical protein
MDSATLTIVEDEQVDTVLEKVKKMDDIDQEMDERAFVWGE